MDDEPRYPRLVETKRATYLVLEKPETGEAGMAVVLRLDGEPTTSLDLVNVLMELMNEAIARLDVPWRDY